MLVKPDCLNHIVSGGKMPYRNLRIEFAKSLFEKSENPSNQANLLS